LGSNERQEHGERGQPHFERHAEFCNAGVTSGQKRLQIAFHPQVRGSREKENHFRQKKK
jgi:hypothetical protein